MFWKDDKLIPKRKQNVDEVLGVMFEDCEIGLRRSLKVLG
jgi:hypothetical protein